MVNFLFDFLSFVLLLTELHNYKLIINHDSQSIYIESLATDRPTKPQKLFLSFSASYSFSSEDSSWF